ncbi:MAG: hypothetical protein COB53_09585 [Elusimicrobia bacterium]|nr:MAG: hypothetical protein COB53_09585 [Elusimicrobiota bacterium]
MPLKTTCGPFQPSLEKAFVKAVLSAHPNLTTKIAVVAPSRRLADRLERLLAMEAGLSLINIKFHTFHSLASQVVEDSQQLTSTIVTDGLFHDSLVDQLLRDGAKDRSKGLSAAYRSSIRDLIDGGLDPRVLPDDFLNLFKEKAAQIRMKDLLSLLDRYLEKLNDIGVLPPAGVAKLAAQVVMNDQGGLGQYSKILYYGFYDLTGVQGDFFHAVAANHNVELFFPLRKDHPAFHFAQASLDSPRMRLGGDQPEHIQAKPEQRALGLTLNRLFNAHESEIPKQKAGLTVFNVSGVRGELWRVAKEIIALTERKKDPLAFHEIGIAARTLEPYQGAIKEVLDEHRIPYAMTVGEPLLRHPIAKLAASLLSLHKRQYPAQSVLDILDSPLLKTHDANISAWKNLIKKQAVHSGWLQWEGKIEPFTKKHFELFSDVKREENEGGPVIDKKDTAAFWEFLSGLRTKLRGGQGMSGWSTCAEHAKSILNTVFDAPQDEPAWEAVQAAIEELKIFELAHPEALWEEFLEAFEEKMRRSLLETRTRNLGVRVTGAMDARGESFKVLFVLGCRQGLFPRNIHEDPLMPDSARQVLRDSLGYWVSPKLEAYEEEKLLFYLLCASAQEHLYCVFPRSSDEGKAQTPSTYLQELCRAANIRLEGAGMTTVPRAPFDRVKAQWEEDVAGLSPKEISLLLARGHDDPQPFYSRVGTWDPALLLGCSERLKLLTSAAELSSIDGVIESPTSFLHELNKRGLSPSALESFSSCPFKFFSEKLLGLKSVEEPSASGELLPWVQGQLYHAILEDFYARLGKSGFWKEKDAPWNSDLDASIAEIFKANNWRTIGVYPVLWEGEMRRMRSQLRRMVPMDIELLKAMGLTPVLFEAKLTAKVGGVRIRGIVDRVDKTEDGQYRVVDYKSRWHKPKLKTLVGEMSLLQAPLYQELLVGDPSVGASPDSIEGAAYIAIEDSLETTSFPWMQEFTGSDWRSSREEVLDNVKKFLGQMRRGEFPIAPGEGRGGACEYCDYAFACRKAHPATRHRAAKSKVIALFEAAHKVPVLKPQKKAKVKK